MTDKDYDSTNIACSDLNIARALARYLSYYLGFRKTFINPLNDPYKIRKAMEMAEQCDLLIVDAFMDREPRGFNFARQLGKKTLLLFYAGELDIEDEGSFWLVFPHNLCRLSKKIAELRKEYLPIGSSYIELEKKFPILEGTKGQHE